VQPPPSCPRVAPHGSAAHHLPRRLHPCFLASFCCGPSVIRALSLRRPLFAFAPLIVLFTSMAHWIDPRKESTARRVDVWCVRLGLAFQVVLGVLLVPRGLPGLALGYTLGMACYMGGRVLTVRGHKLLGAWVHVGVNLFANMGNVLMLAQGIPASP